MGPLVPDIIGNELNFVAALLIGILFGAILEQAGFSTSKKLVGLFYGYDFTVLRVFFTAGVVAMTGVIAFDHFGLIDINLIYINPTFLYSAIVGGLIMGLGFVVGGYCPGTSLCAAAIGKIDAMLFVLGSFVGVFAFAEGYPLFEDLYKAENWGYVRIFDTLGMSQSLFAFLLAAMAAMAFIMTSVIEKRVNGNREKFRFTPVYVSIASIGLVIGLSAFILPERKPAVIEKSEDINFIKSYNADVMTIDELAYRIIDGDNRIQVLDFRTQKEYDKFSLPKSISYNIDNLFSKDAVKVLAQKNKINVITADDEITERKIAFIAVELGYNNIKILQDGMDNFKKQIIEFDQSANAGNQGDTYKFRSKASKLIPVLIEQSKSIAKPKVTVSKRTIGGC